MIVKFLPETEEEIKNFESKDIDEVVHYGVKEYMVFGNKVDEEGDLADFHEWHGSYRYLMGSLDYFYQEINDNRKYGKASLNEASKAKGAMIKRGEIQPNIQMIDPEDLQEIEDKMGSNKSDPKEKHSGLKIIKD